MSFGSHRDAWYHGAYLLFLNLGIVAILLFLLGNLTSINVELFIGLKWLFAIAIFSLTACSICNYNLDLSRNRHNGFLESIFHISPYFFLAILFVIAINQFFHLDILAIRLFHLSILAIAFGFLAFYKNRERIESDLEHEKSREESKEASRYAEFESKFPRISRIWGVKHIARWMYKEGWHSIALIAIILIGALFLLTTLKINSLQLTGHMLESARGIAQTGIPEMESGVIYLRSLIYQYLLGLSILIFGFNVLGATLPGVIFSILNIFLVYQLTKSESKNFGLLCSTAVALSGYLIAYGDYHTYSMSISFILLSLIFSLNLKKRYYNFLYIISAIVAINSSEIGAIVLIFPFVEGVANSTSLRDLIKSIKTNLFSYRFLIVFVFYLVNSYFLIGYKIPEQIVIESFNAYNFKSFFIFADHTKFFYFFRTFQQVFYGWAFLIPLGLAFAAINRKSVLIRALSILILASYIAISIVGGFKEQPRIIFFIVPFATILIVNILYKYFSLFTNKKAITISIILFLILIFNFSLLVYHVSKTYGSEIPLEIQQSTAFGRISNMEDQSEFINNLDNPVVLTSNRWFYFYSDKNYTIITRSDWIKDQVYQKYNGYYRYLFTGVRVIYLEEELSRFIKDNCLEEREVVIADFPDSNAVLSDLDRDRSIRNNLQLLYESPYDEDYSSVWKLNCASFVKEL